MGDRNRAGNVLRSMFSWRSSPAASRLVMVSHVVLWTETLAVLLWPVATLAGIWVALSLAGRPALLPVWLHLILLAIALASLASAAWFGLSRLGRARWPGRGDAERRLERDSGLRHRPFAVMRDHPVLGPVVGPVAGSGLQLDMWRLHRARAETALGRLRLKGPRAGLATHDPYALRAASFLLLAGAVVIAGPQAGSRLAAALLPGFGGSLTGAAPVIQAWIQPPRYTGLGPIFLPSGGTQEAQAISVPAGSRLNISLTGLTFSPSVEVPGGTAKLEKLGNGSFQGAATLETAGHLRIEGFFSSLADWNIAIEPNDPPKVAWAATPGRAGSSLTVNLPWHVSQRWGVAALQAELIPTGRPDLPALVVPLPLPGTPKDAGGAARPDLSANPYAGVAMTGRLAAHDVSGQQGVSETADFILPARAFHQALARAIIDLRRRLALHPHARDEAASDLAALAEAPPGEIGPQHLSPAGITLNMAAAGALLTGDTTAAGLAQAQERLWTLALALDGALPDAAERDMADAQARMNQALQDRAQGKISDGELAKRMQALREAVEKRLADIAREAQKQGALPSFDPKTQHLASSQIDKLMRQIEKAARQGHMDEARQRMAELQKMMEQLKNAKIATPEEMQKQAEQARKGRQSTGAVMDLVQRETGLLDHAQARTPNPPSLLPPQFRNFDPGPQSGLDQQGMDQQGGDQQGGDQQGGDQPDQQGTNDPTLPDPQGLPPNQLPQSHAGDDTPAKAGVPSQSSDARTQRALHRALDALKEGFAAAGGKIPKSLDAAGSDMDESARALAQRNDPAARDAITRAIAELQKGGKNMSSQMSSPSNGQMQLSLMPGGQGGKDGDEGDGEDEAGDGRGRSAKDPFGRQVDGNGNTGDDPDLKVPEEMEQARSRAIQEELRRRGADRQRPTDELNYIDRLLKPF